MTTLACNRCGSTSPTSHTDACRRRARLEDFVVVLVTAPVLIACWPIGTALNAWDRMRRRIA